MGTRASKLNKDFLDKIIKMVVKFQEEEGRSPTQREMVKSLNSNLYRVNSYLHALNRQGRLELDDDNIIRMPANLDSSDYKLVPLVGAVACGLPRMAVDDYECMYKIPSQFCGSGDFFMLRATGDSMVGANIFDGDYLVIRKQASAYNGEIVVAVKVSNNDSVEEATLKRYKESNGKPILHAENDAYDDIDAREYRIVGTLRSVIRNVNEVAIM